MIARLPHLHSMKNTGKAAQKEFEAYVATKGKSAYLVRFDDASDIRGKTGVAGYAKKQPADYLIMADGLTALLEVKSTENPTRFPFSMLEEGQMLALRKTEAAGGNYFIFIKSIALNIWHFLDRARSIPLPHPSDFSGEVQSRREDDRRERHVQPVSVSLRA
jgi:penicillin-binding protein-related factor A (putative recombinase)